jgi:hypothetical protein
MAKFAMVQKTLNTGSTPETENIIVSGVSESSFYNGQSIIAYGTGFKASGATVELNTVANGSGTSISQTVTSQTSTAIHFTVNRSTLSLGTVYVIVHNTDGSQNSGYSCTLVDVPAVGTMPIGMNVTPTNYYDTSLIFTDIAKTGSMMVYHDSGNNIIYDSSSAVNLTIEAEITKDSGGYPSALPQVINEGTISKYSFGISNMYPAETYNIYFDGAGTISARFGCTINNNAGQYSITLSGAGGNTAIYVTPNAGNYIHNLRILPTQYSSSAVEGIDYPTFLSTYTTGLQPFHCLRFMDWFRTNSSKLQNWSERTSKTYYNQSGGKLGAGVAYEYAIDLCNYLNCDCWICVPHMASDDFITQMATLFKNNLNSNLKIYLEYSNEIWNFGFLQTHWISDNGIYTGNSITYAGGTYPAVDAYVQTDLAAIAAAGSGYPWKDAYMMARTFRLWNAVFTTEMSSRVVRVATGQHAWAYQTGQILTWLYDHFSSSCDAFATAPYYDYNQTMHDDWVAQEAGLTYDHMRDSMLAYMSNTMHQWYADTYSYTHARNIPWICYEGGQGLVPWGQNESLSDVPFIYGLQIQSQMYTIYQLGFQYATEFNCQLFTAYDYIGTRQSKYGSWGHLENLGQIGGDYMTIAPKYKALLDYNTAK